MVIDVGGIMYAGGREGTRLQLLNDVAGCSHINSECPPYRPRILPLSLIRAASGA